MSIGARIKSRREELGLSQEELAELTGYKHKSSISKLELSRNLPLRKVEVLAEALKCDPGYLMGWTDDPVDWLEAGAEAGLAPPQGVDMNEDQLRSWYKFKLTGAEMEDALSSTPSYSLTPEEIELVEGFRRINPALRQAIMAMIRDAVKNLPEDSSSNSQDMSA
jgi:transcriptional regulator with XRE-family HTH domain